METQLQEEKPDIIYLTPWMLADVPEPFHPLIAKLIKQGLVKLILDGPQEIM